MADTTDGKRLNRIETKLTKLGDALGVDLSRGRWVNAEIDPVSGQGTIACSGDDISLRNLLDGMEAGGVLAGNLYIAGVLVGQFTRSATHETTSETAAKA